MAKGFLPYNIDQRLLLPPDMRAWLPDGHLALFVRDVVDALDLSAIFAKYRGKDERGRAGYHPLMMLSLLLYAYCTGKPSSRKIEKATHEDVAFRVLSGDRHPDHDSIADFRRQHIKALGGLFVQVLKLCQKAGLVKLGHVAIDGTKIQANASKHKAMSYDRMSKTEKQLEDEVQKLLEEAERTDAEEDTKYGKGKRGDELPDELARRESRLRKIREAKAALEAEAKDEAEAEANRVQQRLQERAEQVAKTGKKIGGKPPQMPDPALATPLPAAQRNFTDPDSRIMADGAHKGSFIQAYNVQIAVDQDAQIIIATDVTQQPNDKQQLVPMANRIIENCGRLADTTSADAGYFSDSAVSDPVLQGTNLLVPPNRQKHSEELRVSTIPMDGSNSAQARMRHKLQTPAGHDLYRMRKAIVEPVFGQMKEVRGFRRFLLRGIEFVPSEFNLIALTHNLRKLFRAGAYLQTA